MTSSAAIFLRFPGTINMQGYRFGKPMPEDEFIAHFESWNPESIKCPAGMMTS